jgi:RNA polymerase sigma-70 factor (ECF subfamily)
MMTRARVRLELEKPASAGAAPSQTMVDRFLTALEAGDEQALMGLLAPNAIFYGDGGGKVRAVVNPVLGAERIVRFFRGLARKYPGRFSRSAISVNGEPGAQTLLDGEFQGVVALACRDGRISGLYSVLNPDKLRPLGTKRPSSLPSTA